MTVEQAMTVTAITPVNYFAIRERLDNPRPRTIRLDPEWYRALWPINGLSDPNLQITIG